MNPSQPRPKNIPRNILREKHHQQIVHLKEGFDYLIFLIYLITIAFSEILLFVHFCKITCTFLFNVAM